MLPLARPPNSTRIPLALAACCLYPAARMASALSTTIVFPLSLNDPSLLGDANVDGDTTFDVINPASKDGAEVLAKVSLMDRSDANRLVQRSGMPWSHGEMEQQVLTELASFPDGAT